MTPLARRLSLSVPLLLPLLLLALTGCAAGEDWARPGADAAATSRAYADCRALAGTAVRTDAAIDQDIAASRGTDIQRADSVRTQTRQMAETTQARSDAIVASCMESKGFTRAR